MANIFEEIGTGLQGVGKGLHRGFGAASGLMLPVSKAEQKQAELARKLKMLQDMPSGSDAQKKMAQSIMTQYQPEIAAMIGQGGYQARGAEPASYGRLTEPEKEKAARIHTGLLPRAESPWKALQEMADTEANLGVDPLTGKPRFPALSEQINKRIGGFRVPGAPAPQTRELAEKTAPWLGRAGEPEPAVVPEGKPSLWENLKKGLGWGAKAWPQYQIAKRVWSKTGEGYTKTSGPDKNYGKPQKAPTMFQLQKEAGIYRKWQPEVDEAEVKLKKMNISYATEIGQTMQKAKNRGASWSDILNFKIPEVEAAVIREYVRKAKTELGKGAAKQEIAARAMQLAKEAGWGIE